MNKGKPFGEREVELLLELVAEKKKVIECKLTDKITNNEKEKCWKEIEASFNSRGSIFRNATSLRNKWFLLKKKARGEAAGLRYESTCTGGGPSSGPSTLSRNSEKVLEVCSKLSMVGSTGGPCSDGGNYSAHFFSFKYIVILYFILMPLNPG